MSEIGSTLLEQKLTQDGLIKPSSITSMFGGICKIGKLIIVNIRLEKSVSPGEIFRYNLGLPKPSIAKEVSVNSGCVSLATGTSATSATILGNGDLYIIVGDSIPSVIISGLYISE